MPEIDQRIPSVLFNVDQTANLTDTERDRARRNIGLIPENANYKESKYWTRATAYGLATLDGDGKIPAGQLYFSFGTVTVGTTKLEAGAVQDTLTITSDSGIKLTPTANTKSFVIGHTNSVTPGRIGSASELSGSTIPLPYFNYDAQGHLTSGGTKNFTLLFGTAVAVAKNDALMIADASDNGKLVRSNIQFTDDQARANYVLNERGEWILAAPDLYEYGGLYIQNNAQCPDYKKMSAMVHTPRYGYPAATTSYITGRYYGAHLDSNGYICVNVPWTDTCNTVGVGTDPNFNPSEDYDLALPVVPIAEGATTEQSYTGVASDRSLVVAHYDSLNGPTWALWVNGNILPWFDEPRSSHEFPLCLNYTGELTEIIDTTPQGKALAAGDVLTLANISGNLKPRWGAIGNVPLTLNLLPGAGTSSAPATDAPHDFGVIQDAVNRNLNPYVTYNNVHCFLAKFGERTGQGAGGAWDAVFIGYDDGYRYVVHYERASALTSTFVYVSTASSHHIYDIDASGTYGTELNTVYLL